MGEVLYATPRIPHLTISIFNIDAKMNFAEMIQLSCTLTNLLC